jgi:hypothetical protein
MQRLVWLIVFAGLGLLLVVYGFLVPAHVRAVDVAVLQQSGKKTPSLTEEGLALTRQGMLGPAQMFLRVAQDEKAPGWEDLFQTVSNYAVVHPDQRIWGGPAPEFTRQLAHPLRPQDATSEPVFNLLFASNELDACWHSLEASSRASVQAILKVRAWTNTVFFLPVASPAGRVLNTLCLLTGSLLQGGHLAESLERQLLALEQQAEKDKNTSQFEQVLLDIYSLGKRLNWVQLADFVSRIKDTQALYRLAAAARDHEPQLPVLFAAVHLSADPNGVAEYLTRFPESGLSDLSSGLRTGAGGLKELLRLQERVYHSPLRDVLARFNLFGIVIHSMLGWHRVSLWATLTLKYLLFFAGGFMLARSCFLLKPAPSALEQPLQVPELAPTRQVLIAFFFLLVMFFLSEPFLAQDNQQAEPLTAFPLRLRLPTMGGVVPATVVQAIAPIMNQLSILSLVLFFILQALIYATCLLKLAEIRRQNVVARLKLKLLENEEHLFDAGLYLGFVGTIISLILMSMGIVKFSLMAGYSSTSFGIIFVSILKIFHVRPLRRKLILESELNPA